MADPFPFENPETLMAIGRSVVASPPDPAPAPEPQPPAAFVPHARRPLDTRPEADREE